MTTTMLVQEYEDAETAALSPLDWQARDLMIAADETRDLRRIEDDTSDARKALRCALSDLAHAAGLRTEGNYPDVSPSADTIAQAGQVIAKMIEIVRARNDRDRTRVLVGNRTANRLRRAAASLRYHAERAVDERKERDGK